MASRAVLGLADGTMALLNLAGPSQTSVRGLRISRVVAVAAGLIAGRPIAVSGDEGGLTHVWNMTKHVVPAAWVLRLPRPATTPHLDGVGLTVAVDGPPVAADLRPQRFQGLSDRPDLLVRATSGAVRSAGVEWRGGGGTMEAPWVLHR